MNQHFNQVNLSSVWPKLQFHTVHSPAGFLCASNAGEGLQRWPSAPLLPTNTVHLQLGTDTSLLTHSDVLHYESPPSYLDTVNDSTLSRLGGGGAHLYLVSRGRGFETSLSFKAQQCPKPKPVTFRRTWQHSTYSDPQVKPPRLLLLTPSSSTFCSSTGDRIEGLSVVGKHCNTELFPSALCTKVHRLPWNSRVPDLPALASQVLGLQV